MAFCTPDQADSGFATASAMMMCAALAVVTAASVGAALAELDRARGWLRKTQAEYALDGVQRSAALAIMQSGVPSRLSWTLASPLGEAKVLAEPEAAKASLEASARLGDETLALFGVDDPVTLRERIKAAAEDPHTPVWIADLDDARRWRTCAASFISPYGTADTLKPAPAAAPDERSVASHVGEVWRVRVAAPKGWVDDRILRFTGDLMNPTATIERRFERGGEDETPCEAALAPHAA